MSLVNGELSQPGDLALLVRRTFVTGIICLHLGATESVVAVLVRFPDDLLCHPVLACVCKRFLLRHDPVMIGIAFLESSEASGITPGPLFLGEPSIMIGIAGGEDLVDKKIACLIA
jgi:hypothetical protein